MKVGTYDLIIKAPYYSNFEREGYYEVGRETDSGTNHYVVYLKKIKN